MKSIKIKTIVNIAACASHSEIAHPAVKPGQRGAVRVVEITGIPDEISDKQVCHMWDETADASYLGTKDSAYSRHTFGYEEIGNGRIISS